MDFYCTRAICDCRAHKYTSFRHLILCARAPVTPAPEILGGCNCGNPGANIRQHVRHVEAEGDNRGHPVLSIIGCLPLSAISPPHVVPYGQSFRS